MRCHFLGRSSEIVQIRYRKLSQQELRHCACQCRRQRNRRCLQIGRCDTLFATNENTTVSRSQSTDPNDEPVKPNLHIVNINVNGVLYTAKLAMHYFRKQPVDESRDRLLILQGSMAGYVDQPGTPQYAASKYALRGMMKSLRRTVGQQDMRVNFIGPW